MSLENPESDNKMYSIAPAEGEKPMSFMTDKKILKHCVTLVTFLMVMVLTIPKENEN